ncbi:translation initiation factor IF-2 [Candidatus Odyssella acanthamoebae]|uniref:Translation initiation factor IF-2 n=1 Tax=Candidatus Odyssella acanthamoebae TaxID=91604 RepID=A0A077AYX7_9PROT|nr:translation initiation factor IF-2 [Candidatus Paracaedibacter acanthamoebae]AIK97209.1 translation initiation factor IF-2 [Candidatus Paracaedibacter acanthamoebae]
MTDQKQGEKKTLTLNLKPDSKKSGDSDQVRQSFSHGRTKAVAVEVKKKRTTSASDARQAQNTLKAVASGKLTEGEFEARMRALQEAIKNQTQEAEERARRDEIEAKRRHEELKLREDKEVLRRLEGEKREREEAIKNKEVAKTEVLSEPAVAATASVSQPIIPIEPTFEETARPLAKAQLRTRAEEDDEEETNARRSARIAEVAKRAVPINRKETNEVPRKLNRNVLSRALNGEEINRGRSMASLKRARQKHKGQGANQEQAKVVREVIIPEFITVGELANRMAVRGADVIKSLMKLGMMVTINQPIDADTAELLCAEFGHTPKRVADSDVEMGIRGIDDRQEDMISRAPVVTIMGHVDHGKTSLLDALRKTDVVAGEAGGITQHIGAYQVTLPSTKKITFIDTPGHAAFTEMRSRGANVTDIVVLVVAADDGIMEQTVEAINHAKAAGVPIIVAINKMDKPEANPDRVRGELLNHGLVCEEFGGDVMSVEVSAKQGTNLDKLEEVILLQAEVLELKANPNRDAAGVVVEAKVDRGRGTLATVLIQKGTLKVGDIFVAGTEWGRVRALLNDLGKKLDTAGPALPVEIQGFNGVPTAGNEFIVVEDEAKAREISEYRLHKEKEAKAAASAKSTMEQMMTQIAAGNIKELSVVVKTDVHGSLEAIAQSLAKLSNEEVAVRMLHGGVGGINESDITLARASNALVVGFNVRANPQARDLARRDGVDIRYYSIIYDVIDDAKAILSGLLAPTLREKYLGNAEIREVFNITKVGKVAGCYVTDGIVKRGGKVRLLRDNVVIHEGTLKTLKRFKEEVREVKESYECGMAFENYNDIRPGDFIECFEIESIARQL